MDLLGGFLHVDYGGDAEFSGDDCAVTEDAADLGDHCGGEREDRRPARIGEAGDEYLSGGQLAAG